MLDYYYKNVEYIILEVIKEKDCKIDYYISYCDNNYFDKIKVFYNNLFVGNYQACRIKFNKYEKLIQKYFLDNTDVSSDFALKYLKTRKPA
jgi:hypothetical protein